MKSDERASLGLSELEDEGSTREILETANAAASMLRHSVLAFKPDRSGPEENVKLKLLMGLVLFLEIRARELLTDTDDDSYAVFHSKIGSRELEEVLLSLGWFQEQLHIFLKEESGFVLLVNADPGAILIDLFSLSNNMRGQLSVYAASRAADTFSEEKKAWQDVSVLLAQPT